MPKRKDIQKIMVIGSGPIVIGQAAEFDLCWDSGLPVLKEEGYSVVLVNSNPATIMTDKEIADRVYIEPITLEFVAGCCVRSGQMLFCLLWAARPDSIWPWELSKSGL